MKKTPVGEESRALADDDSLLDDLLDQPLPEFSAGKTLGEEPDAPPESAAAPRDVKAEVKAVQTEPTILEEAPEPPAPRQAAEPAAVSFVPAEESSLGRAADELMERMEARLQENMRLMVESSLPDLVRSILKEEIEKLKKEIL